jgi:tRNA-specific 2-thiouridylase
MEKVAIAMSGGVDSSVAAALLQERGYQVIGLTMQLRPEGETHSSNFIEDAHHVAGALGIPHQVIDLKEVFQKEVIAPFCYEYRTGRTPNPCVGCNRHIKFGALLREARSLGASYLATGHHTRVAKDAVSGRMLLQKGRDQQKDQSYFLYALTQAQLRHAMFPIGHLTKEAVRVEAKRRNLHTGRRPESQDICFIKDRDYTEFLKVLAPLAFLPGPIQDERGNTVGQHQGIMHYTVGQRRGLGIAASEPQYVIAIEPENNTVIVGSRERVLGDGLEATNINWIRFEQLNQPIKAKARIRYRHTEAEATLTPVDEDNVYVKFMVPQPAITPGQAIVFYDGDYVLGGGTIKSGHLSKGA